MVTCILPPVPGPKIKGFDTHLLEVGGRGGDCSVTRCFVIMTFTRARTIPLNSAWSAQSLPSSPALQHAYLEKDWGGGGGEGVTRCQRARRESQENMKTHSNTWLESPGLFISTEITFCANIQCRKRVNTLINTKQGPVPPPLSYFG